MPTDPTTSDKKRTFLQRFFGISPRKVTEEYKELRFTRARQAQKFFVLTAFLIMLGIASFIALFASFGPSDEIFQFYAWFCLIPFIPAYITLRLALHCVRHAYILLSPMGVEIFPFFKPEKNLRVIFWSEITSSDCNDSQLTLHTNTEKTSGAVVTLKPIARSQISLLHKAINTRTSNN